MQRLSDKNLEELDQDGFTIVPDFIAGDLLTTLQAAQRRVLPSWEEIRLNPPQDQSGNSFVPCFPHEEIDLYKAAMDEESIGFARKWLKTHDIHMRVGCMIARYPGHTGGGTEFDDTGLHVDNGNNSLLPVSEKYREFGQMVYWVHLEDVDIDQAPLRLIPRKYGKDMTKCVPLVCKAGTLCIFTNFTFHSATAYTRADSQRYTWAYSFGRADHYWEGFKHYTHLGKNTPVFQAFIGGLSAAQREIWRFPPVGHHYYTRQTLALLEEQYPGWNSEEYLAHISAEH